MRPIARFLTLCCALASSVAFAAPVSDLYKVREPVASQQPQDREQALARAFDTLLLRLTGEENVANEALDRLRTDLQQVISRFSYEEGALVVSFDPLTTERALKAAGLSLWGVDRPDIMTWWLVESVEGARLLGDAQQGSRELQAAAQHRGLPLRLPLADLSEQLAVTAEALAQQDGQALAELSERYDADGVLAVIERQAGDGWEAQWQFWLAEKQTQGRAQAADRAGLADAVMRDVSVYLAPHYRVAPGETAEIVLEVMGADVSRFAELERLVEPFGASLLRVEAGRLVYHLNASPELLRAQLALMRLHEVPADEVEVSADEGLADEGLADETPVDEGVAVETLESGTSDADVEPVHRPEEQGQVLRFRW